MEIDQSTSGFQKNPLARITPTLNAFEEADNLPSYFKNESAKLDKYFSQAISKSYQILDSFSGYSSYFLLNFSDDYSYPYLQRILQLLQTKDFIKWYLFNNIRFNDAPSFYRIYLVPNYNKKLTDGKMAEKPIAHGFGKDAQEVFSKVIGEFLERYFLSLYHKRELICGTIKSFQQKEIPVLDLKLLAGFSDQQKQVVPILQFDDKSIFYWEKAKRLLTGETVYLPAQLIYWTYNRDELEPFLCEGNTNAAGGFFTLEGSILSGIYELIQRDSFFIYWLNRLTPEKINPKTIPHQGFQELLQESERYGFKIHCLNITSDTDVPAFALVISDPSGAGPRFCLGAGCQADPVKALYHAFEEAWSIYYWMRSRPLFTVSDKNYQPFKEDIGQDERLRLWSNPEMAKYFEFFISGKEETFSNFAFDFPANFVSQKEEVNFLVKRIENLGPGYEVYYFQARHSFLPKVGYYSVQAVIPQFVPLYLNERNAPLGSLRLKEVPKKIGFEPAKELNPWPHPFP